MGEIDQLQNQVTRLGAEIELLRGELAAAQDFSSGVLVALKQVLISLLPKEPEISKALAEQWREASADFQADPRDSAALLEARHLLFVQLSQLGAWTPKPAHGSHP